MYHRINEVMSLFEGYNHAYGIYNITGEEQGKKILGRAASLKGPVTVELWHDHLAGKQGLGIIPINEHSKVKFAAIDIDEYNINLIPIWKKILDNKLPLTICKTKSGGLHLYMFLTDWTDAGLVQRKMRDMAAFLGFGSCEVFPKQTKIIVERGDIGQWINMPYFMAAATKRPAIGKEMKPLNLDEFLEDVKFRMITPEQLLKFTLAGVDSLRGGPPCLQHLIRQGFPDGTRNNGLFNLGVYAKKKDADNWPKLVEEMNVQFMDPPLTANEVLGVIKSLNKKEFSYMCEQPPIKSFCNKDACRGCEFGIGGLVQGFPRLGSLTKLSTEPPIWFIEVEGGGRLELSTEELQSPMAFQTACMKSLNIMPQLPKRDVWTGIIQQLLEDVIVVEVPKDATPIGQLWSYLEDFCTSKVQGKTHDELLLGKPWTNDGKTFFRMKDFLAYLDRVKFRLFTMNHIAMHLKEWGAEKSFFNVRGKGVNCYSIKEFSNKQTEPFSTPVQGGPKPYE
jgi:hypothetical protein